MPALHTLLETAIAIYRPHSVAVCYAIYEERCSFYLFFVFDEWNFTVTDVIGLIVLDYGPLFRIKK